MQELENSREGPHNEMDRMPDAKNCIRRSREFGMCQLGCRFRKRLSVFDNGDTSQDQ